MAWGEGGLQALPLAVLLCALEGALADLAGHSPHPARLCAKPVNFLANTSKYVAPRPFALVCGTPSSAHFLMDARDVSYDGRNEDEITMDIISQGPVPWSISRFNQGDFAPRLGPKWEASQGNLGVRAPRGGSSLDYAAAHCSQAWRPHRNFGVILPTVAKNGQDWGDGFFYGTAAVSDVSGGFGYSMVDGTFGFGDCDVIVGKAGEQKEANIDVAVSWLPYSAGFLSGFVAAPLPGKPAEWSEPGSHSPLLPAAAPEVVAWHWGRATREGGNRAVITLPGYTAWDGMLFAAATDGGLRNNDLNIVSVRPAEGLSGWEVQVHEDFDPTRFTLAPMQQWMFCFLFIPFQGARHLHAVHVNGVTGQPLRSVGSIEVQRVSRGRYWLRVLGKGPLDGVWLLQCAGQHKVSPGTLNAFLSYEWDELVQAFVVEVRHVSGSVPPRDHSRPLYDNKLLHQRFPQSDADFYALWMDHRNPPTMAPHIPHRAAHAGEASGGLHRSPWDRNHGAALGEVGGGADDLAHRGASGFHSHPFIGGFLVGVAAMLCGVLLLQAVRGGRSRQPESRAIIGTPMSDTEGGLAAPL